MFLTLHYVFYKRLYLQFSSTKWTKSMRAVALTADLTVTIWETWEYMLHSLILFSCQIFKDGCYQYRCSLPLTLFGYFFKTLPFTSTGLLVPVQICIHSKVWSVMQLFAGKSSKDTANWRDVGNRRQVHSSWSSLRNSGWLTDNNYE